MWTPKHTISHQDIWTPLEIIIDDTSEISCKLLINDVSDKTTLCTPIEKLRENRLNALKQNRTPYKWAIQPCFLTIKADSTMVLQWTFCPSQQGLKTVSVSEQTLKRQCFKWDGTISYHNAFIPQGLLC